MITVIAEHSVDLDLLPEKANILDLGCRGFLFFKELNRLGHRVVCVDCDDLPQPPTYYHNLAITNYNGFTDLYKNNDPQATRLNKRHEKQSESSVQCLTLKSFSDSLMVASWDLIKMDIEGSEYEVIMSLTEPPAKQLSIEFHLHTGIYGTKAMVQMQDKLHSLGYISTQHQMTTAHGLGFNFWDSLFILK